MHVLLLAFENHLCQGTSGEAPLLKSVALQYFSAVSLTPGLASFKKKPVKILPSIASNLGYTVTFTFYCNMPFIIMTLVIGLCGSANSTDIQYDLARMNEFSVL